jgi:hypothetical protein
MSPILFQLVRQFMKSKNISRLSSALHLELLNRSADSSLHRYISTFSTGTLQDLLIFSNNPCKLELRFVFDDEPLYLDRLIQDAYPKLPSIPPNPRPSRAVTAPGPLVQIQSPESRNSLPRAPPVQRHTPEAPRLTSPTLCSPGVLRLDPAGVRERELASPENGDGHWGLQRSPDQNTQQNRPVFAFPVAASPANQVRSGSVRSLFCVFGQLTFYITDYIKRTKFSCCLHSYYASASPLHYDRPVCTPSSGVAKSKEHASGPYGHPTWSKVLRLLCQLRDCFAPGLLGD